MKNQYSFRLTTTVLPTDLWSSHPAKTTQVINKVDANGNKFYPNFTEETVVITNDDRTIMETTRATCTDWVLTFVKRGLSDDDTETQIDNRKLTWNPGSLCFITAWASDWIDRDDDMSWQWDQTYLWKATYKWRLITEKWVEYPHFNTLADLQDYWTPFGWMFAVVDASWELYRYNDVTESWDVITTNEPTNPEQADDETIGTVRVATDAEFEAGTETWSQWEYLMPTVGQVKANIPSMDVNLTSINQWSQLWWETAWSTSEITYTVTHAWFITVIWVEYITSTSISSEYDSCNYVDYSWTAFKCIASQVKVYELPNATWYANWWFTHRDLIVVSPGTFKAKMTARTNMPSWHWVQIKIQDFFYFW